MMCDQESRKFTNTHYFIQADEAVRMMRQWETDNADLLATYESLEGDIIVYNN